MEWVFAVGRGQCHCTGGDTYLCTAASALPERTVRTARRTVAFIVADGCGVWVDVNGKRVGVIDNASGRWAENAYEGPLERLSEAGWHGWIDPDTAVQKG
jgi:hypothetical protein